MLKIFILGFFFYYLIHVTKSNPTGDILGSRIGPADESGRAEYIRKVAKHWTKQRMRRAKPVKMATFQSGKSLTNQSETFEATDEIPEFIEGQLPINFTSTRIINPVYFPTITVGKLFFETFDGSGTCTASVVIAPSRCLVITAAHCLFNRDYQYFYNYFYFVPSYDEGDEPYYGWTANYMSIHSGYATIANEYRSHNYDYGFLVMDRIGVRRIGDVVGSQGISFNARRGQTTFSFGFPGEIAYGEVMSLCLGKTFPPTCTDGSYTGEALRCVMEQGSSGGPWIQQFDTTNGIGFIYGVNSYGCPSLSKYIMHGPHFNSVTKTIYDGVKNRI